MKRFAGWAVSAGLLLAAFPANAQMLAPYGGVSDFDGPYERPYAAVPPAPSPGYNYGGYGPSLLPPQEVYAVLRDNGFSPLGIPHQRGYVYVIAAVDRRGESGRLVIDARNGQILRFAPAYGYGPYGGNYEMQPMPGYGPQQAPPPPSVIRGSAQPQAQEPRIKEPRIKEPHVASRAVPLPTPKPTAAAKPPGPVPQQSAAIETRPATPPAPAASAPHPAQTKAQLPPASPPPAAQASPPAAQASNAPPPPTATIGEGKPAASVIHPTQPMPAAQGLE